jgi:hypothetical protein
MLRMMQLEASARSIPLQLPLAYTGRPKRSSVAKFMSTSIRVNRMARRTDCSTGELVGGESVTAPRKRVGGSIYENFLSWRRYR